MDSALLPQEICDAIIDNLWTDVDSLRNCALVSSAWLPRARSHLFYRIQLGSPVAVRDKGGLTEQKSPCEKLFTILKSPTTLDGVGISQYVREFHLTEGVCTQMLAKEPTLPLLLRSLHNLRRFDISNPHSIQITWDSLPGTLKAAIQDHVLCLPSLTELKLGNLFLVNLSVMKDWLQSCKHLKILEVQRIWVLNLNERVEQLEVDGANQVSRGRIQLDALVIGPGISSFALVPFLLHPDSCVEVGKIRKLTLSTSTTFDDFAELLHASASVEQLELTLMDGMYWELPSHRFNLSWVPHLQNLKVHIRMVESLDGALPWLKALLDSGSSFSGPNAIVKIWIIFDLFVRPDDSVSSLKPTIIDKWAEIDALLCGVGTENYFEQGQNESHAYERLKEVKLELQLKSKGESGFLAWFSKQLVLNSPGLTKRGISNIHVVEHTFT